MLFTRKKSTLAAALFCSLTIYSALSAAEPEDGKRPCRPPPEAFSACADLAEGDACSFAGRQAEEVQGSCITPPRHSDELVCAPKGKRPPRPEQED